MITKQKFLKITKVLIKILRLEKGTRVNKFSLFRAKIFTLIVNRLLKKKPIKKNDK